MVYHVSRGWIDLSDRLHEGRALMMNGRGILLSFWECLCFIYTTITAGGCLGACTVLVLYLQQTHFPLRGGVSYRARQFLCVRNCQWHAVINQTIRHFHWTRPDCSRWQREAGQVGKKGREKPLCVARARHLGSELVWARSQPGTETLCPAVFFFTGPWESLSVKKTIRTGPELLRGWGIELAE